VLTETEFDDILKVLTDILAMNGGRAWFNTVFQGPEFPKLLSVAIGQTGSDEQVAGAAIQVCINREWLDETPCWMERMLISIHKQGETGIGEVTNMPVIIDRIHNKINIRDQIWYHNWVLDDRPFVDRNLFRETLTQVARVDGRPILRIEGESKTGKSYSRQLLQYVSLTSQWSFKVIQVEIREGTGFTMNSLRLAQQSVGEMGGSTALTETGVADPSEDDIPLLLTWIWRIACNASKRYWIFLDGFRFLHQKNSARSLIQALADKIANGNYRQWLRLVLVDFDEELTQVDEEDSVAYDRPDPAKADANAILDCLRQCCIKKNKTPDDAALLLKAQAIVASALANQPYFVNLNKTMKAARKSL
jgi:hypothetical protein